MDVETHQRVEAVVAAFAKGEIVVVADDDDRENEGDLFVAASLCTPEKMAFIIRNTSGIVCAPLSAEQAKRLHLDPMVAAGSVAKKWLFEKYGTTFRGCMTQIGDIAIPFESWAHVPNNPFFAPVADVSRLETYMDELRKAGDSCGARIRVTASGVPVGLGDPLFDKLDADIAFAMMGINAVKGIEIGAGFASVTQRGTTHGDSLSREGFLSNNAGGVLGGISTGQDLEVSIAIKPTSSIITPRQSIDTSGQPAEVITKGRHDPCVGIRATPIAEAMLALVVMEHALRQRAQNADVQVSTPDIMRGQKV